MDLTNGLQELLTKVDPSTIVAWMILSAVMPAFLAVVRIFVIKWRRSRQLKALPRLTVRWDAEDEAGWKNQLRQASSQFVDRPFVLDLGSRAPPQVVLPRCLLDEVRRRPDALASLRKDIGKLLHSRYTGVGEDHPIAREVLRKELTNHIPVLLPILHGEVRDALDELVGQLGQDVQTWQPVAVYHTSMKLCSQVIGRFFVGSLCKSAAWQGLAASWDRDLAASSKAVSRLPWWARPLVARWLPAVRRIEKYKGEALRLLEPDIAAAVERYRKATRAGATGKISLPSGGDVEELNVLNWMLNYVDTSKPLKELGPILAFEILILGVSRVSDASRQD